MVLLRYPALLIVVSRGPRAARGRRRRGADVPVGDVERVVTGSLERPHITPFMAGLVPVRRPPARSEVLRLDLRCPEQPTSTPRSARFATGSPTLGAALEEVLADPCRCRRGTTDAVGPALRRADAERTWSAWRDARDGVWVQADREDLGVRPGDTIVLSNASRSVEITVDGIYADLYLALPPDGYWLQWEHDVRAPDPDDVAPPPQPLLADRDQALALARALGQRSATFSWQAPIADPHGLSFEDVQALDRYVSQTRSYGFMQSRLGQRLQCCGRGGTLIPNAETTMNSSIDAVVSDAERRIATVQGPAQVLEIAAITIALVVVAASGAFSVRARGTEAGWLFARGTAPSLVAAKSALEAFLPAVAGGVLGWAIACGGSDCGPGRLGGRIAYAAGARAAVAVVVAPPSARPWRPCIPPHGRPSPGLARIAGAAP
jgi:hypothetical protein